ncbi:hypothetical protein SAMN05421678_105379, partial [Actinopolymorpha cephalotaxi]
MVGEPVHSTVPLPTLLGLSLSLLLRLTFGLRFVVGSRVGPLLRSVTVRGLLPGVVLPGVVLRLVLRGLALR